MLAIGNNWPHHLEVEKKNQDGPEIIKQFSDEEIDEIIWHKGLTLGIHRTGLAAARKHFYEFEEFVEQEINVVNQLRAHRQLEPLASEVRLDLQKITRESPDGLARLNRRIVEVELALNRLTEAGAALEEYHNQMIDKRHQLLGGQELQDFVDEESRPDQGL